jgi:DNA-binding MarR family transcriptional regulator
MPAENAQDELIKECLGSLDLSSLCEWDVLFFIHRYGTIVTHDGELAPLVGYENKLVSEALDKLEDLGLVVRSRLNANAKAHQLSVKTHSQHTASFQHLARAAATRVGRLILAKQLKAKVTDRSQLERGDQSDPE